MDNQELKKNGDPVCLVSNKKSVDGEISDSSSVSHSNANKNACTSSCDYTLADASNRTQVSKNRNLESIEFGRPVVSKDIVRKEQGFCAEIKKTGPSKSDKDRKEHRNNRSSSRNSHESRRKVHGSRRDDNLTDNQSRYDSSRTNDYKRTRNLPRRHDRSSRKLDSSTSPPYSRRRKRRNSSSSSVRTRRSRRRSSSSHRSRKSRRKSYSSSPHRNTSFRRRSVSSSSPRRIRSKFNDYVDTQNKTSYQSDRKNDMNLTSNSSTPILVIANVLAKISEQSIIENLIKHGPTPKSVRIEPSISIDGNNDIFIEYEDFELCRQILKSTKEIIHFSDSKHSLLTLNEYKLKYQGRSNFFHTTNRISEKPMSNENPCSVLIFRSLDYAVTEEQIRESVNSISPVPIVDVRLIKDRFTGTSRGFSFVELSSIEHATQLLNILKSLRPPYRLGNRRIVIDFAKMDTYSNNGLGLINPGSSLYDSKNNGSLNPNIQSVVENAIAAATSLNQSHNFIPTSNLTQNLGTAFTQIDSNVPLSNFKSDFYSVGNSYNCSYDNSDSYSFENTAKLTIPNCESNVIVNTAADVIAAATSQNKNYDYTVSDNLNTIEVNKNTSTFVYDNNSGYYYDPVSKYFYNPNTCQYLRYNETTSNWDVISYYQQSVSSLNEPKVSTDVKSGTAQPEKTATAIAKDMERWAKKQKQKKASALFKPVIFNCTGSNIDNKGLTEPEYCYFNNKLIASKNNCILCLRTFQDEDHLKIHLELSEFHKLNLLKISG